MVHISEESDRELRKVVKEIVEDFSTDTVVLNDKKYERVLSPNTDDIVLHYNGVEFVDVKVVSGKFWGEYNRVSNFWYWLEKDENGNYTIEKNGYGNFYVEVK